MICSDLLIYKVFPKQNNISLYDRGTKLCAARTAERCESSCPTSENGPHFPRSGPITDWTDTNPLPKS